MLYQNWLITGLLHIRPTYCAPLKADKVCDVLVIGGGFAGLHAALRLANEHRKVILLEKNLCGSSSSGQSGGFLTPESEEDFAKLIKKYGKESAEHIYTIPQKGVDLIVATAHRNRFKCDLRKQDSLYLSSIRGHNKSIEEEAAMRQEYGFSYELLDQEGLERVHPGKGYLRGLKYPGSYGINSFAYAQELKNLLIRKGVAIYEDSEVHAIEGNMARTALGTVTAKHICICIDKMKEEFNQDISKHYYHIQTSMSVSEPLSPGALTSLFPTGELMCWDTRWNYIYYRPIYGNRLLVGGSSAWSTYDKSASYSPKVIVKFINELKERFPVLQPVDFPFYWSGLIDVTKDLTPIADYDPQNNTIQYAMGCAGLPWAAFCGDYIARRIIDSAKTEDLSSFLGIGRKHILGRGIQSILGKRIVFGLNHLMHLLK